MSTSDKLHRAGELRNDGNAWFKRKDFARAARRYGGALNLISLDQGCVRATLKGAKQNDAASRRGPKHFRAYV
jgi:hypothetical protein